MQSESTFLHKRKETTQKVCIVLVHTDSYIWLETVKCLNEFLNANFFRLFVSLSPQNEITISTAVK